MTRASTIRRRLLTGGVLLTLAALAVPGVTAAKAGDIIRTGSCSGATDWKLKLSPEGSGIEAEAEIDQNRNGVTWNYTFKRNGVTFASGQRTTRAPSGSFEVRKVTGNAAGTDAFVFRAVNPKTGEVCRATASI